MTYAQTLHCPNCGEEGDFFIPLPAKEGMPAVNRWRCIECSAQWDVMPFSSGVYLARHGFQLMEEGRQWDEYLPFLQRFVEGVRSTK